MVKILHAADFHMDSPFASLPEDKAAQRRREQRELLDALAAAAEKVDVVLLAGDLFDTGVGYWETVQTLTRVLSGIRAQVFIAPGNHDYYTSRSPYALMELPENIHIFKTPQIRSVELPELGVRVHGDIAASSRYNAITEDDIARSGLDYLALGHTHSFSGLKKAGNTWYAYPGCLEGRGFDETGPKGLLVGSVGRGECELDFKPIAKRQYRVIEADLSSADDALAAAAAAVGAGYPQDVARLVLRGEFSGEVDTEAIATALGDKFFHLTVKNELRPRRGLWDGAGEDTLTGLFLAKLKAMLDEAQDEESRERIRLAARYALAALEGREEWRP